MNLTTERYLVQKEIWPTEGRHILAHFDADSVVVYQAYAPRIGQWAAQHGRFGGDFSFTRMSWFKPNFLWMMYRSGWGTKPNQEVTLAVRIRRAFFDFVLEQAVPSAFDPDLYADKITWKRAVDASDVRLQWDPDHAPSGEPLRRRAIQLGLRGNVLEEYGHAAILEIEDISAFVEVQRAHAQPQGYEALRTPTEQVYVPAQQETAKRLALSPYTAR